MAIPMTEEEKKRRLVLNSRRPAPTFAGAESVAVAPDARRPVLPVDQLNRKVPSNGGLGAMMGVAGFQNPTAPKQVKSYDNYYEQKPAMVPDAIERGPYRLGSDTQGASDTIARPTDPPGPAQLLVGPVPDADRARRDIVDSERRRMLGNRAAMLLRTPPVPGDAAGSGGRIDSILEATRARDHAEGANRAPQRELSAEAMQAGRDDLLKQGLANADIMRQRATSGMDAARERGDAAGVNALQPELYNAVAVEGGMRRTFGTPLTPEQIAERQDGQKATIARQKAMQEANAMLAEEEAARENGVIASRRGLETASRDLGLKAVRAATSGMDRTIAENQSAADPAALSAGRSALLARGQTDALRARTEQRTAEAQEAESKPKADSVIRNAGQLSPDFQEMQQRLTNALARFGAGGYLGAGREGEVSLFVQDSRAIRDYIDTLPPDQAAATKQALAAKLVTDGGIGDTSPGVSDRIGEVWDTGANQAAVTAMGVLGGLGTTAIAARALGAGNKEKRRLNTARWRSAVQELKSYLLGQ